jgi:hypothetical protein
MYRREASLHDLPFQSARRSAEALRHVSHRGHSVALGNAGSHDISHFRWRPHSPDAPQRDFLVAYVRVVQQVVQSLAEIIASRNDHVRDDTSHREVHDFLHDIRSEREIYADRNRCRASMKCGERAEGSAILRVGDFQEYSGWLPVRHPLAKARGTRDEVHAYLRGNGAADRLPVTLVRE